MDTRRTGTIDCTALRLDRSDFGPIGYQFGPSPYTPPLGRGDLDVVLGAPGIDPRLTIHSVTIPIHGARPATRHLKAGPSFGPLSDRLAVGRITLTYESGDHVYAYSFGGRLAIEPLYPRTRLRLTSEAPLFSVSGDPNTMTGLLLAEIEGLMARQRATWGRDDAAFAEALAAVSPFDLFRAALVSLRAQMGRVASSPTDVNTRDARQAVKNAIAILAANSQWPLLPGSLESLLRHCASFSQ
jgi:hypothetical protein